MISPESYYEEYLKGKTKEEIMTAIRGLKQEIGRLKVHWKILTKMITQLFIRISLPTFTGLVGTWKKLKRP